MNRAIEGPFDKQPLCEKDIPGEALKLAGIALGIDRTAEKQARPQEVIQEAILIFSADWPIQQLKVDVGGSLLVPLWAVDPENGADAELEKSWIRFNRWVPARSRPDQEWISLAGSAKTKRPLPPPTC